MKLELVDAPDAVELEDGLGAAKAVLEANVGAAKDISLLEDTGPEAELTEVEGNMLE